jgi:hypothetical protein
MRGVWRVVRGVYGVSGKGGKVNVAYGGTALCVVRSQDRSAMINETHYDAISDRDITG